MTESYLCIFFWNYLLNINKDKKNVINDNPITNLTMRNDAKSNANGVAIPEIKTILFDAIKLVYRPKWSETHPNIKVPQIAPT